MLFELKKPESVTLKRLKQVSKYANEDEQAQYLDLIEIDRMNLDLVKKMIARIKCLEEGPFKDLISKYAESFKDYFIELQATKKENLTNTTFQSKNSMQKNENLIGTIFQLKSTQ